MMSDTGTDTPAPVGDPTGGNDSGFTPPATQADLDRIISDRVAREKAKYAGYDDLKAKAAKFDEAEAAAKTELEREREAREKAEAQVAQYQAEKQVAEWAAEVAAATGVPADALRGQTREELEAHAAQLRPLIEAQTPPAKPQPLVIPSMGNTPPALNSSKLEESLRLAVGAGPS